MTNILQVILFVVIEELIKLAIVFFLSSGPFRVLSYFACFLLDSAIKFTGLYPSYTQVTAGTAVALVVTLLVATGISVVHVYQSWLYARSRNLLCALVFCTTVQTVFKLIAPAIAQVPFGWHAPILWLASSCLGAIIYLYHRSESKLLN